MSCQTTQVISGRERKGGKFGGWGGGCGVLRDAPLGLSNFYAVMFTFFSFVPIACYFAISILHQLLFFETLSNHHPGPGQFILRYVLAIELLIGNLMCALAKLAEMKERLDTHVDLAS